MFSKVNLLVIQQENYQHLDIVNKHPKHQYYFHHILKSTQRHDMLENNVSHRSQKHCSNL